ncbi:hypothetical protein J2855_005209 [Agrobacterium tumefaciens]|uniref:DUF736 domain-containing protein n=1 Tax=Agrobacterium tumefaciens TaxID=358 RepID=A0AAW8M2U0_AGRTU|nr:hypothetical protein [Agrobacterium tumefaciens]MBP2520733.1 hypothetical protein [Agrobacterium tumefaciens]MBP2537553.1 hypothetical protein [Agrobacterium tumefaciens]MBP2542793.1 hypothetical protein [Agrobacterium tumefaciens]MBP2568847.1 hypothetical protein [Agrobacterium tumefaciens]
MTDLVNFIRFNADNTLTGNIASVAYDLDIFGEEFDSTNTKAPVYRLFAKTPRDRRVEIGGIWKKQNRVLSQKRGVSELGIRQWDEESCR